MLNGTVGKTDSQQADQMANPKLDELHLSMGEFLTACAHLENMLWALLIICELEKTGFQEIAKQFLPLTFGDRVNLLEKKYKAQTFSTDHRAILDKEFDRLREMVPKRNLIVHGTTYEIGFGENEPKPLRIGAPKGNLEHMQQLMEKHGDVGHSFTADHVREVSGICDELRGEIAKVVTDIMTARARKK
jgi:hypothetical protein